MKILEGIWDGIWNEYVHSLFQIHQPRILWWKICFQQCFFQKILKIQHVSQTNLVTKYFHVRMSVADFETKFEMSGACLTQNIFDSKSKTDSSKSECNICLRFFLKKYAFHWSWKSLFCHKFATDLWQIWEGYGKEITFVLGILQRLLIRLICPKSKMKYEAKQSVFIKKKGKVNQNFNESLFCDGFFRQIYLAWMKIHFRILFNSVSIFKV